MEKYLVRYDRSNCISAAECVSLMPELWEFDEDGKANLKGSVQKDGLFELEIDEAMLETMKRVAAACPVAVIQIINKNTGARVI